MTNELGSKTSPKDVFLHLLAIATLYVSAISLITLFFQYVNYWFPDALAPFRASDAIRWAIASLLIIFPAHIIAARFIRKDQLASPEKREGKLRKWLLYLTLFLAAVTLIGDLVALVFNFLQGELSIRFYLKVLAVAVVAGGVFWYYLWDLRRVSTEITGSMRKAMFGIIGLVAIAVVGSFFVIGSPFTQRLAKFDQRRASDLRSIQWQIVNYWQRKDRLPVSLDDIRDDIAGFVIPRDPETAEPYEYRFTGPLSFELCATFRLLSENGGEESAAFQTPISRESGNWAHGAGKACFPRTIDPDLYRVDRVEKPALR